MADRFLRVRLGLFVRLETGISGDRFRLSVHNTFRRTVSSERLATETTGQTNAGVTSDHEPEQRRGPSGLDTDMVQTGSLVIGIVVGFVVLSWLVRRVFGGRSRSRELSEAERESLDRHRDAQGREPPVELGDVREIGIKEFTRHHSGERHALGKVEGFVIFVEDIPNDVEVADVIRVKILSFNRGHTSATATFLERA